MPVTIEDAKDFVKTINPDEFLSSPQAQVDYIRKLLEFLIPLAEDTQTVNKAIAFHAQLTKMLENRVTHKMTPLSDDYHNYLLSVKRAQLTENSTVGEVHLVEAMEEIQELRQRVRVLEKDKSETPPKIMDQWIEKDENVDNALRTVTRDGLDFKCERAALCAKFRGVAYSPKFWRITTYVREK